MLASTNRLALPVQNAINEASLGTDTVDLKSTAATPSTPINNVEIDDLTPTLTVANANGTFVAATFNYVFAVYDVTDGGMTLVETGTAAQGTVSTSYQIQMPLADGASFQWRVRPFLDDAFGPWSALASFTTAPSVVIDPPTPTFPINGVTVTSFRPAFNVINGNVKGDAGEVIYQIQVALDSAFSSIVAEEGTHLRSRGDTNIHLQNDLMPETHYFWHVRGRNDGQGKTGLRPGVSTVVQVVGDWGPTQDFFTSVVIDPPTPTFPINGVTVTSFRPAFNVINGNVKGDAGEVIYQIQVALDSAFSSIVAEEGTHLRSRGDTNIHLQNDLMPETHYFWHVRGRNDGQGKTGLRPGVSTVVQVVGDWGPTQDFFTPRIKSD